MPSKTEEYLALAQRTANGLTRYWESWTAYLTTASRLYKYPFADQLMIYAQRPDATACADFDIWNNRMNRYVRRGAKGIALLDESSGFPRLHYVFDVSDTGVRRNSRDPEMWQYNDDLKQPVSEMLSKTYGISGERVSQQLADVAGKLVADYWDNNGGDIRAIVDGSLLMDYDEAGVEMQFKSAAAMSVTYTLLERCGFEPAGWFDKDDFQAIYNFSTPDNYVTESTFDAYLYQTLENKQKFISQIMTSKSPMRSCDDIDEQALSYAEIKALCAGDPRIREKMDLDVQVAKLKVLRGDFQNQKYRLEDKLLKTFPEEIQKQKTRIAALQQDSQIAAAHPQDKENFCGMTIKGMVYDDKKAAGERLLLARQEMPNADMMLLGTYRGFELNIRFDSFKNEHQAVLRAELSYPVSLGDDARGNITRLDNAIDNFADRIADAENALQNLEQQKQAAEVEVEKPFPQEEELAEKSARLAELNALLNIDRDRSSSQDAPEESEETEAPATRPSVLAALDEKANQPEPVKPFKSYLDKEGR